MAIENDQEFEEKFAQLGRYYRALGTLWQKTNPQSQEQIAQWIIDGGKILEALSVNLGEIEEYTGTADLRIMINEMATIRAERQAKERSI
jgi:hypothetical protein